MGILDLSPSIQSVAMGPQPGEQTRLPATFSEGFDAAWQENQLFGQSIARTNARMQALDQYVDEVRQKTGKDIGPDVAGAAEAGEPMMWMAAQQQAKKLGLEPPSDDEITDRAAALSRQARTQYSDIAAREKAGGGAGLFLGGLASSTTDPLNLVAAPVGGGEGGVLLTALKFGAGAAAIQGGNEALQAGFREQVQPGYAASGEPLANVLTAGVQGAVIGGGTKVLGNLWTRVKTGAWPTSVRDAGNILESEANVQQSNIYPGAAGEAAHRDALATAVDQVTGGEPVDVSRAITPEIEASARGIMTRLEGEQAVSLPIFDERAVRLTSEEAGLRQRATELDQHIVGLPQGDLSAADRLNRLEAIDQQIASAPPQARKALTERRDQILVDTSPEALQAAAAPITARRAAQSEQAGIAARLNEIATERARPEQTAQPMLGQRQPSRLVPFEQVRAATRTLSDAAAVERAGGINWDRTTIGEGDLLKGSSKTVIEVPTSALDNAFRDSHRAFYVKKPSPAVMDHIRSGQPMSIPEVSISKSGRIDFADGRNRAAAREMGEQSIPIAVERGSAQQIKDFIAKFPQEPLARSQPELPFAATAREAQAAQAGEALKSGIAQVAERGGHTLAPDEIAAIAARMAKMEPEEAANALRDVQTRPHQMSAEPARVPRETPQEPVAAIPPAEVARVVASPEHEAALRADIDRARMTKDVKIPAGVDEKGEPVFRSLDSAMDEVDGYKAAADQIKACAAPQPEPEPANG